MRIVHTDCFSEKNEWGKLMAFYSIFLALPRLSIMRLPFLLDNPAAAGQGCVYYLNQLTQHQFSHRDLYDV